MATGSRMTADDLWRMDDADVRRELVEGRVIEMPLPGGVHGLVSARTDVAFVSAERLPTGVPIGFARGARTWQSKC